MQIYPRFLIKQHAGAIRRQIALHFATNITYVRHQATHPLAPHGDPMKKLSLTIEDLRIESFTTDAADGERGTVQGAQITAAGTCQGCYQPSEPGYRTYVNNMCIRC